MKRKLVRLLLWLLMPASIMHAAQPTDTLQTDTVPDLPTDIKASIFDASAGDDLYTSFGHCAIRLECPSKGFDICFTFALDDNYEKKMTFFTGKGFGTYNVMDTQRYIESYSMEHRTVTMYELNLTLDEIRLLWEQLDTELSHPTAYRYDYLHTNCSSMCMKALEAALIDEEIVYDQLPPSVTGTYRDFVRSLAKESPWSEFFWQTLLGSEGEETGILTDKISPFFIADILSHARFKHNNGSSRPVLKSSKGKLVNTPSPLAPHPSSFTPTICMAIVLLVALLLTAVGRVKRKSQPVKIASKGFDALLLISQTLIGLLVCYMTFGSQLSSAHHNWYALVFNPLPLLAWLFLRRRPWYSRVWAGFGIIALLFVCSMPFNPQLDWPHAFLLLAYAVRCLDISSQAKRTKETITLLRKAY